MKLVSIRNLTELHRPGTPRCAVGAVMQRRIDVGAGVSPGQVGVSLLKGGLMSHNVVFFVIAMLTVVSG